MTDIDLGKKGFDPRQPRDAKGRWAKARLRLAQHPIDVKNIVDVWDQATEGERATGKNWYPNAHKVAVEIAKDNDLTVEQAAGLLAVYSAQTRWGSNMRRAHAVARAKQAVGGPGAHIMADVNALDEVNEVPRGVMATGHAKRRAAAILVGEKGVQEILAGGRNKNGSLPPNSLKVRAFAQLIEHGGQPEGVKTPKVVIDRHAASVARGMRMNEDDYSAAGPSSSMKRFTKYADAYREAAEIVSSREGRTVTPEEMQAVTWLVQQRLTQSDVKNADALGQTDMRQTLHYFAQYDPDIADIIDNPMVGTADLANWDEAEHPRGPDGRFISNPFGAVMDIAESFFKPGRVNGAGTKDDPIDVQGDHLLAAKLIAEGKHVRLNRVDEVGTLLDELVKLVDDAKAKGEKAPNYDLCRVSVPGTNLFCAHSKDIPRAKMPQLSGKPLPGSKADALPRARADEVDILPQFREALEAQGVSVTDARVPAHSLKATQNQLIGPKVAGISKAMETAPPDSGLFDPIFVTKDGYVIDGHHRWASNVAWDAKDGDLDDIQMNVMVIDLEIGEALAAANEFAEDWGIPQQGFTGAGFTGKKSKAKGLLKFGEQEPLPGMPDAGPRPTPGMVTALAGDIEFMDDDAKIARAQARLRRLKGEFREDNPTAIFPDEKRVNTATVPINGQPVSLDKAYYIVADAYDWRYRDEQGGNRTPEFETSVREQGRAQIVARSFHDRQTWMSPQEDQWAASTWKEYQNPEVYGDINKALRHPDEPNETFGENVPGLIESVDRMFDQMGYSVEEPVTTYRALKSTDATGDWAQTLKPGVTIRDRGIVSTTAHPRFSAGWLLNGPKGVKPRNPDTDDVVIEIRLPEGQRVVGGDPQFIETMLPPNTPLRIISSNEATAYAVDPLRSDNERIFQYTHVVAEVVPSEA